MHFNNVNVNPVWDKHFVCVSKLIKPLLCPKSRHQFSSLVHHLVFKVWQDKCEWSLSVWRQHCYWRSTKRQQMFPLCSRQCSAAVRFSPWIEGGQLPATHFKYTNCWPMQIYNPMKYPLSCLLHLLCCQSNELCCIQRNSFWEWLLCLLCGFCCLHI